MSEREQFEAAFLANPSGGGLSEFCWRIWQAARAQPAQAGQYTCQNGDKCKHGSWCSEVYCQELCQFRKPAQAGQVLTDAEISLMAHNIDDGDWSDLGFKKSWHEGFSTGARAIEQAVLAKRVPMTLDQIKPHFQEYMVDDELDFVAGVRFAERHHGITGEKGGA